MKAITCPISSGRVPAAIPRLVAFFVATIVVVTLLTGFYPLLLFLAIDFFIRGFLENRKSPLAVLALLTYGFLGLQSQLIDRAPKAFAAKIGFVFSIVVTLLFLIGLHVTPVFLSSFLLLFALLEFGLGICVGCLLYTYLVVTFRR
jgi:hypothetical protein